MSNDNVQILRDAYDAFARQDVPSVMAAFHEDIEWDTPDSIPFGGSYHGHDGVGSFFSQLPEYWEELRVEPQEFIDAGETIVVLIRLSGKGAAGPIDSKSLHLWRMRDGEGSGLPGISGHRSDPSGVGPSGPSSRVAQLRAALRTRRSLDPLRIMVAPFGVVSGTPCGRAI